MEGCGVEIAFFAIAILAEMAGERETRSSDGKTVERGALLSKEASKCCAHKSLSIGAVVHGER